MKPTRWILALGAAAAVVAVVVAACVIDDDPTWLRNPDCTGTCNEGPPADYSCDVDSSCTPAPGCTDWDCTEAPPDHDGDDGDVAGPVPDAAEGDTREPPDGTLWGDGDFGDDTTDVPSVGDGCRPSGGGETRDAPQIVTLGVELTNLVACPSTSQWFAFDAEAGLRFVIELVPEGGGELAFLLYAGEDPAPIASATMTGPGSYVATAGTTGRYYLRLRAVGEVPVSYSLTVGPGPAR